MHSSPPPAQSWYSELVHAFAGPPQPFAEPDTPAFSKLAIARPHSARPESEDMPYVGRRDPLHRVDSGQLPGLNHTSIHHPQPLIISTIPAKSSVAVNLSTPDPESSTRLLPLPTAWTEGFRVSGAPSSAYVPPSAPDSAISATQGSWWCNDRFIAVYQSFFVPRSINDRPSRSPALARGKIHCPDTLGAEQVNSGPAPQDHGQACTALAPAPTGNTARPDTADQCEVPPAPGSVSWSLDADGVFIDWSVPPAMAAPVAPVDPAQWVALEMAAMVGYVWRLHLQASLVSYAVPEEAYAAILYSPPPTVPSSYSELAHAFAGSPQPFTDADAPAPWKLATARYRKSSRPDAAWAQTSRQDRPAAPASSL
ncbi:hypothetical protein V8D89_001908 [Ganoderma adspersum]